MFMCMPLVEFMFLVFICILGESYCRQFRCLLKCQLPLYFVNATVPQCHSLASLTHRLVLACGYWIQHNLPDFWLPEFPHASLHTTILYCLSNIQADKLSGGWILCAKPEVAYESSYDKRAVTPSTSLIPHVTKYRILNLSQYRNLQCQLALAHKKHIKAITNELYV